MEPIKVNQENWDGILYPVENRKDKVMIVMSGSDGGLEHAGKLSRFLQDNGIPALLRNSTQRNVQKSGRTWVRSV